MQKLLSVTCFFLDVIPADSNDSSSDPGLASGQKTDKFDSREIILCPSMFELPFPRPFREVSKRLFIGNAVRLGLENYFKEVVESVKRQMGSKDAAKD